MSGWGVSILFDTSYLNIENTVSDHIRSHCILRPKKRQMPEIRRHILWHLK